MEKSIFKSKTLYFNALVLLVSVAGIFGFDTFQPSAQTTDLVIAIVTIVNIILRFLTKVPVRI